MKKSRIKVAFVLRDFQSGGCQKQVYLYLKHLDKSRFEPHLFTLVNEPELPERGRERFFDLSVPIHEPPRKHKNRLLSIVRWMTNLIVSMDIHIILSFQLRCDYISALVARKAGIKGLIINDRGDRFLDLYQRSFWRRVLDKRLVFPTASGFVANSVTACDLFVSMGIPKARVHYMPNGIEIEKNAMYSSELGDLLALRRTKGQILFGFVANLKSFKGHENLVHAVNILVNELGFTSFLCVCIGYGDQANTIENLVATYKLSDHFLFTGNVDASGFLPFFDIGLNLSQSEGFPNSVLEYMVQQVPVIATRVGNIPHMLENDESALLVEYGDVPELANSMFRLASDEHLRKRLAQRAYEVVVSRYSIERVVGNYQELFFSVVKEVEGCAGY